MKASTVVSCFGLIVFSIQFSSSSAKDFRCSYLNVKVGSLNETFRTCEYRNVVFRGIQEAFTTILPVQQQQPTNVTHNQTVYMHNASEEQVERLSYKSSRIYSVPNSVFTTFKNVRVFDASHTRLHEINSLSFNRAEFLNYIFLRGNQLTTISNYVFVHCRHLKILDLSSNKIGEIHKFAFNSLAHLEQLNLAGNRIKSIEDDTLQPLIGLEWIWLNDNKIKFLSSSAFAIENSKLIGIYLSENAELTAISAHAFESLKMLRFLFLTASGCINENFLGHVIHNNVAIKLKLKTCSLNYVSLFPDADTAHNSNLKEDLLDDDCKEFIEKRRQELKSLNEAVRNLNETLGWL